MREVAVHLQAQLAGRHDDEGARRTRQRPFGVADDAVQQRDAERIGLAHAGAGLTDEVVAGQRQRHGQFLDGEGVFDAFLGERANDLVADAEHGECLVKGGHAVRYSLSIVSSTSGAWFVPCGLIPVLVAFLDARTSLGGTIPGPGAIGDPAPNSLALRPPGPPGYVREVQWGGPTACTHISSGS